ncbi:MAG: hypothetical protein WBA46_10495, partial [Thermomicrobiales bacterium]
PRRGDPPSWGRWSPVVPRDTPGDHEGRPYEGVSRVGPITASGWVGPIISDLAVGVVVCQP